MKTSSAALLHPEIAATPVRIDAEGVVLPADCTVPPHARGMVIFAHGSGSSRRSPRNRHVARRFYLAGFGTLLLDLLPEEEGPEAAGINLRFDIDLLTLRLRAARDFAASLGAASGLRLGYFGSSTGAAAALRAAAEEPDAVHAVVSRGGRPDLADDETLSLVSAPTLLIVGGLDALVLDLNRRALTKLSGEKQLVVVPGATHLFEEPGCLDAVADLAIAWFDRHLGQGGEPPP